MNRILEAAAMVCVVVTSGLVAVAQNPSPPTQKPCIAFAAENSATAHLSRDALQAALTQGSEVDFYPTQHSGCWTVHEISASLGTTPQGYAISWIVTDLHDLYVAHGLNIGQQEEFTKAMQSAEAAALKDIRAQRPH